jgi:cytochrome-b5 reductase
MSLSMTPQTKVVFAVVAGGAALAAVYLYLKNKTKRVALDPKQAVALVLQEKITLSHDSRLFRFALPTPEHILGLPTGQHIMLSFTGADGVQHRRAYTPTSSDDDVGIVDFVVKVYFKDVHPKFPAGGKLSQHLESLAIGDTIDAKGPKGKIVYAGPGHFDVTRRASDPPIARHAKHVGMIAGGTGITPMLQVVHAAMKDPADRTQFRLLYANKTADDILLRKELDELAAARPDRFKVWYTIDGPPTNGSWKFSTGHVCEEMLKAHMPPASSEGGVQILMCGPPPMIKFACMPNLEKLGYTEEMRLTF